VSRCGLLRSRQRRDNGRWEIECEGVTLSISRLGGLVGTTWLSQEFDVANPTAVFVVESVLLQTNGRQYPIADPVDEKSRTARPCSTVHMVWTWDFAQRVPAVFGRDAVVTLHVRMGEERRALRIQFEKQ
jgi:hypothetical protein